MAVKAKAEITISRIVDIASVTRYYLLQSSTASAPSKPTANPPGGNWTTTEPTYTSGSTNTLYFTDLTLFTNDTFSYSAVSKSSSFEAAKAAYNKAVSAQSAADAAKAMGVEYIVGTQTASTNAWKGTTTDASLYVGKTIAYKLPYAGTSSSATLNLTLSDGTTTGAKGIRRMTTTVTTNYPAESVIWMTYDGTYWRITDYNSDTYDRVKYSKAIKCGSTAIVAGNIIVGTGGLYKHLKAGTAFDISYPILYASSAISASSTGTNNYTCISFTVTTTQSITLTAYKPVYIKGTLSGTSFTPISTSPLTQTLPTSDDGYYYILLGQATASNNIYLMPEHPIYKYFNGGFKTISQIAVEASRTATNHMEFGGEYGEGLVIADLTGDTLGRNIHIQSDGIDLRSGQTILATFQEDLIELGKGSDSAVINLCKDAGYIYGQASDFSSDYALRRLGINAEEFYIDSGSLHFEVSQENYRDDITYSNSSNASLALYSPDPDVNGSSAHAVLRAENHNSLDFAQISVGSGYNGSITELSADTVTVNSSIVQMNVKDVYMDFANVYFGQQSIIYCEGNVLDFDCGLDIQNEVTIGGNLYMDNGKYIIGKFTDGSDCLMALTDGSDQMSFGYSGYAAAKGATYFDGNVVNIRSNSTINAYGSLNLSGDLCMNNGKYIISKFADGSDCTMTFMNASNQMGFGYGSRAYAKGEVYIDGNVLYNRSNTSINFSNNSTSLIYTGGFFRKASDSYEVHLGGTSYRFGYIYLKNNPSVSSDIRLKENIDYDMDKYIAMVDKLKPMSYNWIYEQDDPDRKRNISYGAQYVWKAMKDVGLDESDFGGVQKYMQGEGSVYSYSLSLEQFVPILHARQDRDKAELLARIERIEKALGISDAS